MISCLVVFERHCSRLVRRGLLERGVPLAKMYWNESRMDAADVATTYGTTNWHSMLLNFWSLCVFVCSVSLALTALMMLATLNAITCTSLGIMHAVSVYRSFMLRSPLTYASREGSLLDRPAAREYVLRAITASHLQPSRIIT